MQSHSANPRAFVRARATGRLRPPSAGGASASPRVRQAAVRGAAGIARRCAEALVGPARGGPRLRPLTEADAEAAGVVIVDGVFLGRPRSRPRGAR